MLINASSESTLSILGLAENYKKDNCNHSAAGVQGLEHHTGLDMFQEYSCSYSVKELKILPTGRVIAHICSTGAPPLFWRSYGPIKSINRFFQDTASALLHGNLSYFTLWILFVL